MEIKIKRVYEDAEKGDGYRVLIDRLWPRGVKKDSGKLDKWLKEVAPSTELRKWFNHEPEKWEDFRRKYHAELKASEALSELTAAVRKYKTITLLYAAKDEHYNHAIVLQQFLKQHLPN